MNILVTGSGGREHALVWKLKQSSKVKNIFVAPGNAGTLNIATNIQASTTREIIDWLKDNKVDLVIVGPDSHLAEGIVDEIQKLKIPVFGPTKDAAEIEWSKSYAKEFMREENIPTADFKSFTVLRDALEYIEHKKFPLVIKASGLALGKGVIIAEDIVEAKKALEDMMSLKVFGNAGSEVVIEEYLAGREISIHAFCDGKDAILFPASQDHKRIFDGDRGPNTGGMGTIAPVPWVTDSLLIGIKDKIIIPTLRGLKKRGRPFVGVLFPGIMVTDNGPKVIEFNARFGDPETQSYMRLLETDLVDICLACLHGSLKDIDIKWSKQSACCIVLASGGYPGKFKKNLSITGMGEGEKKDGAVVFHAGTSTKDNSIITNGGRVLGVTTTATNLQLALNKAYRAINNISFEGMQFRKDIGVKSLTSFDK